ncbi:transforming growth factor beta receptor type 3-like [Centruroides vittatus]|uniref:transforming growth factor beta receptor type 3-like n=2 Tax=Centruroides TaxID=6875 RepID=UPI00350F9096
MATYLAVLVTFLSRIAAVTLTGLIDDGFTSSCVVKRQFQSPYVTPILDQVAIVTGCSSQDITSTSQEIHVISLGSSGYNLTSLTDYLPTVSLLIKPQQQHSTHAGPLVVVLHATNPVMWQLFVERISSSSRLVVVVTEPSQLVSSAPLKLSTNRKPQLPLRRLLGWVQQQYGSVTSLSRISVANTVTLTVGTNGETIAQCDTTSMAPTERVWASYIQPQPVIGCAAERKFYSYARDVHIVELLNSAGSREILLHLQPQGEVQASVLNQPIVERDILIVLKCHTSIKWKVQSWGIKGILTIVSEQEVEARSLPNYQPMQVEQVSLPNDTESLLVLTEGLYNPVLTLTKAAAANKVNIFVDGKKDKKLQNIQSDSGQIALQSSAGQIVSTDPPSSIDTSVFARMISQYGTAPKWSSGLRSPGTKAYMVPKSGSNKNEERRPNAQLIQEMELRCLDGRVKVSFAQDKVESALRAMIGGQERTVDITMTDPTCRAQTNSTHYYIESSLQSCGSRIVTERNKKIYYNQILFWIQSKKEHIERNLHSPMDTLQDDEDILDETGSGNDSSDNDDASSILIPLSFQCVYNLSVGRREHNLGEQIIRPQSYKLRLYLDKNFYHMVPQHAYPLKVVVRDFIYVQVGIEAGPYFGVMPEQCWLSEARNHHHDRSRRHYLLQHRCPVDRSVELLSAESIGKQITHQRRYFSFQLKEQHVNHSFYLHCHLIPCSSLSYLQTDGITACVNPEDHCVNTGTRSRSHAETLPNYASYEVCGPIQVVSSTKTEKSKNSFHVSHSTKKTNEFPDKHKTVKTHSNAQVKEKGSQRLLFAGLSTEMVVGIAFASFVTGAGLMSLLWFIHLRTDPTRQDQNHQHNPHRHHHSGCDLSGQSGSSTPSSQAPMTSHTCG